MLRRVLILALLASLTAPAGAFPQFHKQFKKQYGEGSNEDFNKSVKEAKCYACHQGKKKKNLNPYGEALHEFLDKKDKKDTEKIIESLEKVAEKSSNPDDPEAPTFGDLIAEGKLPGGTLEDAKKEPEAGSGKKGSDKKE